MRDIDIHDYYCDIVPEIKQFVDGFYYHKKVSVKHNTFSNCCSQLVYGWSIETLIFSGNKVTGGTENIDSEHWCELTHFGHKTVQGNDTEE